MFALHRVGVPAEAALIVTDGDQRSFALAPSRTQDFVQAVRVRLAAASAQGAWPAILTSAEARPFVRGLVERINGTVAVISHNEVHPRCKLRMLEPI